MNPIALRLSAISLTLEGCGMPEIVEALQIAEREILRLESLIPPKPKRLVMVCGVDCKPGDVTCNNYCNMAPQKGPMASAPPPGPDALLIVVCAECGMRHWADTTVPVCILCEKPINGPLVPATEGEKAARARSAQTWHKPGCTSLSHNYGLAKPCDCGVKDIGNEPQQSRR